MKIPLNFRRFILKEMQKDTAIFYESLLIKYSISLNHSYIDYYDSCSFLMNMNEEDYCGMGIDNRAKYYLYDYNNNNFYWFVSSYDASMFAEPNSPNDLYLTLRRQKYKGFIWLLPEDIDDIEDIINSNENVIMCLDNNKRFNSVDEAARWLTSIGKSANDVTAKRQLEKHLKGGTKYCYGYKFIEE